MKTLQNTRNDEQFSLVGGKFIKKRQHDMKFDLAVKLIALKIG